MRTLVLVDGPNLYHLARQAWAPRPSDGKSPYDWPSFDILAIADAVTATQPNRRLVETRFYTGVPRASDNRHWHYFWTNKLRRATNQGVHVFAGRINRAGQEKGVDVALAIDLVQATHERSNDAAVIVSRDTDFGPAVRLCKEIARTQGRQVRFESAFPQPPGAKRPRGVPGTVWSPISKETYDSCRDHNDYRPRPGQSE